MKDIAQVIPVSRLMRNGRGVYLSDSVRCTIQAMHPGQVFTVNMLADALIEDNPKDDIAQHRSKTIEHIYDLLTNVYANARSKPRLYICVNIGGGSYQRRHPDSEARIREYYSKLHQQQRRG